ncbi:MAG: aldo/keto reductase [Pseudomonadota bacterium]
MTHAPAHLALGDGMMMPQLGLGLWRTADADAPQVVRTAIEAGYRLIDTAAVYGNERGVGQAMREAAPGSALFVTTKLWTDDHGYDQTLRAFDASLRRLGLADVALYLIHWPAPERDLYVDSWRALIRLKAEGRACSIGVSNFAAEHLRRLVAETGVAPVVNQVELHPRLQQRALRSVHAGLGIRTQSWSPLDRGRLLRDPTVMRIAAHHGKTAAQVIVRWHVEHGLIVIPKSGNAERIRENIDVFDFQLAPSELAALDQLE